MKKIILAFLLVLMSAAFAAADTLYLRNGQAVRGTVLGFVSGRFAVKLSSPINTQLDAQTNSQNGNGAIRISGEIGDIVFIRPRDVDRVEIEGRSLADARYITRTVRVELGPNWVDTGVDLRRGERVQVSANGTIVAGRSRITPGGLLSRDPNAPMPSAAEGVLIGAIGTDPDSPIIEIGLNREFIADRAGRLYLTVNRANYTDARGAFTAQIRRELNFNQNVARNRDDYGRDNEADDLFGPSNNNEPAPVRPRVLGNNQPVTSNIPTPVEKTLDVPGNSQGTDTGIDLRTGDTVTITATGSIIAGRRAGNVSPEGGRVGFGSLAGTYPVSGAGVGALIGYIRTPNGQATQPFLVGSQQTITSPVDGRLILLVNDDNYSDNSGSFHVKINYTPAANSQTNIPANTAGGTERVVNVSANTTDVDTGIDLRRGDRVTVSATGAIYSRGTGAISPEGDNRYDSYGYFPAPDAPFGALVGYIRMSNGNTTEPFLIGSQRTFFAPTDGRLILTVNDDDYRDNTGSFRVRIVY